MKLQKNHLLNLLLLLSTAFCLNSSMFAMEDEDFDDETELAYNNQDDYEDDEDFDDESFEDVDEEDMGAEDAQSSNKQKATQKNDLPATSPSENDEGNSEKKSASDTSEKKKKKKAKKEINPAAGLWHVIKIVSGAGTVVCSPFVALMANNPDHFKCNDTEDSKEDKWHSLSPSKMYPLATTMFVSGVAAVKSGIDGLNHDGILEFLAGADDDEDNE